MDHTADGAPPGAALYAAAIALSAFLLFVVQPIIAREILPWFGGAAGVWTTCVLFFQAVLLAGYAYAHWLVQREKRWVHAAVLAAGVLLSRIVPATFWKPIDEANPIGRILGLLITTVGLPYFCLACTSPLVQSWYVRGHPGRVPYRFFALSNFASMTALLGYPLFIETGWTLHEQATLWSASFVLCAGLNGWLLLRVGGAPMTEAAPNPVGPTGAPGWGARMQWAALAACASALLLAVTNYTSQNIAAIPLLWVVPLAAYLLSFILTFESPRWYRRGPLLALFCLAVAGLAYASSERLALTHVRLLLALFIGGLFLCCMVCHGELARRRPEPAWLTGFYLWIAAGGAIGALFVAVIAPLCFSAVIELPVLLVVTPAVLLWALVSDRGADDPVSEYLRSGARPGRVWGPRLTLAIGALLALGGYLAQAEWSHLKTSRRMVRNFYGALRVTDHDESGVRTLVHGMINHGEQYLDARKRRQPLTYYGATTGVGRLLAAVQHQGPMHLGVIGLGTSTMAAWVRAGDRVRFYEINPAVVVIAREDFHYLADCAGSIAVVLGDARLSLERESTQRFDVLVVDAFSGDSIPVHLLTREAIAVYRHHLAPDGVLAIHITNTYLDLAPPLVALANELGLEAREFDNPSAFDSRIFESRWLLVGDHGSPRLRSIGSGAGTEGPIAAGRIWTDDYSDLWEVLRR